MKNKSFTFPLTFSLIIFFSTISHSQNYFWQRVSPEDEGSISSFAVSPLTGSMFLTRYYGLSRSTDDGKNWIKLDTSFKKNVPRCIAISIAQTSLGFIYVGTEKGIFKSTNDGLSWGDVTPSLRSKIIYELKINSHGDVFFMTSDSGIYRSTNDGLTWKRLSTNQPIFYWDKIIITLNDDIYTYNYYNGIYKSTDNGENWIMIDTTMHGQAIRSVQIASNGFIYVGKDSALYRSTDNGKHWTKINSNFIIRYTTSLFIMHSPVTGDMIFVSYESKVFVSSNYGDTWQIKNEGILDGSIDQFFTDSNGVIYGEGYGQNLYRSTNNGEYWDHFISSNAQSEIKSIVVHPKSNNLYAASSHNGLFQSSDQGKNWIHYHHGLRSNQVSNVAISPRDFVFVINGSAGVYRSSDNCQSWKECNTGLPSTPILALAAAPNGDVFVGITDKGIFLSTDDGDLWKQVYIASTQLQIFSFVFGSNGEIYAATTSGVLISANNGHYWVLNYSELLNPYVKCITRSEHGSSKGYLFAGTYGSTVHRSIDDGTMWQGLISSQRDVNSIIVDQNGYIYSSGNGVSKSTDDGVNWKSISDALSPRGTVTSLAIDEKGYIFAGANYYGIYRSIQPITFIKKFENGYLKSFSLNQNYPNPFTTYTTIPLQINSPSSEFATIKVYDVFGREIKILFEGELSYGEHEIIFSSGELTRGQYFIRMTANNESKIIHAIVIK